MTTWLPRWFALLLLVLPFFPAVAADPDDKEIERLVKQLGSDKFKEREAASKRLTEIGEPALDALDAAKLSNDAEVRCRASDIVAVIEDKVHPEHCLTAHTNEVYCVCVSADGQRVLTSGEDKTLRLWDADTGKCLRVFEGHTDRVQGAALSSDGKRVLSGSGDRSVRLWDATTGKELRVYKGHTGAVYCVCFGPEGQALSGGNDGTMHLWELNTGKKVGIFDHTGAVCNVAYSPKARLAATSSSVRSIRLWDLGTGKEVRTLKGHTGLVRSVCFAPDGQRIVSGGYHDNTVRVWDAESGKGLQRINANACCVAVSPDGRRIASGGYLDNTVRVWDAATGKELRYYEGHTGAVTSVAFFPDGKRIAAGGYDGTVRIWRAPR